MASVTLPKTAMGAQDGATAGPKKKKSKTKAAKVPAGEAAGADQKGAPSAAEGGGVGAAGGKEPAPTRLSVSAVRVFPETCPGQQLDFSGDDSEAEAGHGPTEAAVSVLPETSDGQGVLDSEQGAQLPRRRVREAASLDAARCLEGRGALGDSTSGDAEGKATGGSGRGPGSCWRDWE
jgi:hypothetical protein